ncbi:ETRAMP family protein [Polaribacter aestuariivivens]|uniref:ETRAMP family protein n=1 Tax=Polaribacter aestuariivivens TaxID=2304626 RepID=UPI0014875D25|nr:ETRAMP family protein [Polaribacter aestuariivivens]
MKKVFLVFAILLANGVFTSCTDLEDETTKMEILATGGEDGQDPDEEEDPANGG